MYLLPILSINKSIKIISFLALYNNIESREIINLISKYRIYSFIIKKENNLVNALIFEFILNSMINSVKEQNMSGL